MDKNTSTSGNLVHCKYEEEDDLVVIAPSLSRRPTVDTSNPLPHFEVSSTERRTHTPKTPRTPRTPYRVSSASWPYPNIAQYQHHSIYSSQQPPWPSMNHQMWMGPNQPYFGYDPRTSYQVRTHGGFPQRATPIWFEVPYETTSSSFHPGYQESTPQHYPAHPAQRYSLPPSHISSSQYPRTTAFNPPGHPSRESSFNIVQYNHELGAEDYDPMAEPSIIEELEKQFPTVEQPNIHDNRNPASFYRLPLGTLPSIDLCLQFPGHSSQLAYVPIRDNPNPKRIWQHFFSLVPSAEPHGLKGVCRVVENGIRCTHSGFGFKTNKKTYERHARKAHSSIYNALAIFQSRQKTWHDNHNEVEAESETSSKTKKNYTYYSTADG